uniref:Uncharacterized protein n=1 Tax=Aegilops tauschii subsp. strangulata TaxID=200361 RepID=A0A453SF07_AEGTS
AIAVCARSSPVQCKPSHFSPSPIASSLKPPAAGRRHALSMA